MITNKNFWRKTTEAEEIEELATLVLLDLDQLLKYLFSTKQNISRILVLRKDKVEQESTNISQFFNQESTCNPLKKDLELRYR